MGVHGDTQHPLQLSHSMLQIYHVIVMHGLPQIHYNPTENKQVLDTDKMTDIIYIKHSTNAMT